MRVKTMLMFVLSSCMSLSARTYETSFPVTENPISENGNWVNGQAQGVDWSNVSTTPGFARGQQVPGSRNYNDSVALVSGAWGADQTVRATVRIVSSGDSAVKEVEIRLRSTVTAHNSTGYEIFWSAQSAQPYLEVARWNGPLNDFTILGSVKTGVGMANGDAFAATIVGGAITAYINGIQKLQVSDPKPFSSGNPGIGFYLANSRHNPAPQAEYGFSSFTATDDSTGSLISTPRSESDSRAKRSNQ
jgi:hypothetical protein